MDQEIYDEEEISEESEVEIPVEFYGKFNFLVLKLVRNNLERFFEGQKMYCGGPVSKAILFSPQVISMVLNITIVDGVDKAYSALENCSFEFEKYPNTTNHMVCVLKVLDRCSDLNVPPCFRGGIILAWLRLCMGIRHGR